MEKIYVRITGRQKLSYNQIVEMNKKEWEEIKSMNENDAGQYLGGFLDYSNPIDSEDIEDWEADVVDENGNLIKPRDSYTN